MLCGPRLAGVEFDLAEGSTAGERRGSCLRASVLARRKIGAGRGVVDEPEQIVRGVRVGKRLVLGDETVPDHFEQRLLERSEEHTSELQSPCNLVCRLLLEQQTY